jgi:hypothetical protein
MMAAHQWHFGCATLKGAILWASGTPRYWPMAFLKLDQSPLHSGKGGTTWKSPRTGALWPVDFLLKVGDEVF